jgi:hypothetical protein
MEEPKPKEYVLTTMKELFELVNQDNVSNLVTDFGLALVSYAHAKAAIVAKGMSMDEVETKSFTWIDDGKHDIELKVKPKD